MAINRAALTAELNGRLKFGSWPHFERDEIDAVVGVLKSGRVNYWTGEQGRLFEKEFAESIGVKYAVAVANGTLALELALYALGIGPGDEVIVPCKTFIATASAVVARGAVPVVADIDLVSQNIIAETLEVAVTPRTKAIIVVHLAGWPCDMEPILDLAKAHDLKVIEDCAQAHGAKYRGRPVGSMGDAAAFSFCQDKIMTTGGEGGMLVTSLEDVWERAWSYKDHGKKYGAVYRSDHPGGYRWVHESFGSNWRLTEMQSAIGRAALPKVKNWVRIRRQNAVALSECFSSIQALRVEQPSDGFYHSYYKYYAFVRPSMLKRGWDRDRIMAAIRLRGVPCGTGCCSEIYLEKAFGGYPRPRGRLKNAKMLGETSIEFQVHPTLTRDDMRLICSIVEGVMDKACDRRKK